MHLDVKLRKGCVGLATQKRSGFKVYIKIFICNTKGPSNRTQSYTVFQPKGVSSHLYVSVIGDNPNYGAPPPAASNHALWKEHRPTRSRSVTLRVGTEPHIYMYIRCVYTVFLAGKSPYLHTSYTVQIYGSGQP